MAKSKCRLRTPDGAPAKKENPFLAVDRIESAKGAIAERTPPRSTSTAEVSADPGFVNHQSASIWAWRISFSFQDSPHEFWNDRGIPRIVQSANGKKLRNIQSAAAWHPATRSSPMLLRGPPHAFGKQLRLARFSQSEPPASLRNRDMRHASRAVPGHSGRKGLPFPLFPVAISWEGIVDSDFLEKAQAP
jgi:hypothetical protein